MSQSTGQTQAVQGFTRCPCQAGYNNLCSASGRQCQNFSDVPTDMVPYLTRTGEITHTEGIMWDRALKAPASIIPDGRIVVNLEANGIDGVIICPVDAGTRRHLLHIVQPSQDDIEHGRAFEPFSCFTLATRNEADILRSKFPGRMMTPTAIVISSDQKSMQFSTTHVTDGEPVPAGIKLSLFPPKWDRTWYNPDSDEDDKEKDDMLDSDHVTDGSTAAFGSDLSWARGYLGYDPESVLPQEDPMTYKQRMEKWPKETDDKINQRLGEIGWDESDFDRFFPQ